MIGASIIEKIMHSCERSTATAIISAAGVFVVGLMLMVALASYNPEDPSLLYGTTHLNPYITNILGYVGASIAAMLFFFLGLGAYLLIPLCFFISFRILTDRLYGELDCITSCILGVCSFSALCTYYKISGGTQMLAGGKVGMKLFAASVYLFDAPVAPLFLFVCASISLILIFRISWAMIGRYAIATCQFMHIAGDYAQPAIAYCMHALRNAQKWIRDLWLFLRGKTIEHESMPEFEQLVDQSWHIEQEQTDAFWNEFLGVEEVAKPQPAPAENLSAASFKQSVTEQVPVDNRVAPKKPRYRLPNIELFKVPDSSVHQSAMTKSCEALAQILEEKLERFGIKGAVTSIKVGPVITLFEYEPDIDSKISKIIALEDDLALALQAVSIRIIAPIPGRSVVGFEVSNKKRTDVLLSSIVHAKEFKKCEQHLPLILGHDVIGKPIIIDLTTTPHLLVAGSTGSGKSVALNAMLVSLLCKHTPDNLKLILIDPKRLEFASYSDMAHLLFPIVTDPKKAAPVLRWVIQAMEQRYCIMEEVGVRNIFEYHELCQTHTDLEHMPFMVVMIDELSDLMMTAGKEIEDLIARIAQMARAAGIHMIIATQRPSVDVITGLIKVNFPSRISFRVTSKVDSRTILDCSGADKLLGKGDMLYLDSSSGLNRAHGAYVSQPEIDELVAHIKSQQPADYIDLNELVSSDVSIDQEDDALYQEVVEFLHTIDEVSISLLQRKFRIGYNRSARIIELLEAQGLIIQEPGGKTRKVVH